MSQVFLSYRREDSQAETRLIYDALQNAGHDVFFDRAGIQYGDEWAKKIKKSLDNAGIVIVVIGKDWLTCRYEDGRRRIDNLDDWVRHEVKESLQSGKKIIPVLVRGAVVPAKSSLPDDIQGLVDRQMLILGQDKWESDIKVLLATITETHETKKKPFFILTSASPRRRELLRQIGWAEGKDYITIHASVNLSADETTNLEEAMKFAETTARKKIHWVMHNQLDEFALNLGRNWNHSETILIGVDTIVFCKNKILDRPLLRAIIYAGPKELEDARKRAKEMLSEQRGEEVCIITSLAVATANEYANPACRTFVTRAKLRDYSDEDIENYIIHAEPFDKAGAFGIQEKGVSLFERISGSYTNIVGLPLQDFFSLLQERFGEIFELPLPKSMLQQQSQFFDKKELSVLSVGDINYDFVYDKLPTGFFQTLSAPGKKVIGAIHRGVGGTGVNFAKGARMVGFKTCFVVGVIGGDELGQEIVRELHQKNITPICPPDPSEKTSVAIILRDIAKEDTSVTLTDSHQSLPDFVVERARVAIQSSDVFYCSGYCLTDDNRFDSALKMLRIAKDAHKLVVVDIVVGTKNEILDAITKNPSEKLVDVAVSELPEIFSWFNIDTNGKDEIEAWQANREILISVLRKKFSVTILRASKYTDEIIITPSTIIGPHRLDYKRLGSREKVGYGDFRTAVQIHHFLSPRIVLASKSPQRFDLLSQVVAPSKIEVVVSNCTEDNKPYEEPANRVKRLAQMKADAVFRSGKYHDDIELIIGADTEIIFKNGNDMWDFIGHPETDKAAIEDLTRLSGKDHYAITGIAVIGRDPQQPEKIKVIADCIQTKVTFAELTSEQIKTYVETGEPIGRAGSYAIQGLGALLISNIDGSYSNVVGLPLERLTAILADEFGKPIWLFDKVSNWSFPNPIKEMRKL